LDRAKLWTLDNALACSRYHNLMHRRCDLVEIANRSNLVDSFCSGIIQTNSSDLYKTPAYYAQQLYATHAGQYPVKVRMDTEMPFDPALDVSATTAEDGKRLAIFVVNSTTESQKRTIDLTPFGPMKGEVGIWTLADTAKAGQRDAANSWREPARIRTEAAKAVITNGRLTPEFPALSVTVLEMYRASAERSAR
jgi:alpha-L-arabinofuranosidase